jgi:hypothetical protein
MRRQRVTNARPDIKFDGVALAVSKSDRFDPDKAFERPGKTHSGILPA